MINSLLIGCGNIGFQYDCNNRNNIQTHFRALHNDNRFRLISTVDKNLKTQLKIKNEYGVECVSCLLQIDGNILQGIDLIVISTAEAAKVEILSQISTLGIAPKAILYEKPVATSVSELKSFIDCLTPINSCLRFNFMRRANPSYQWLRKNLEKVTGSGNKLYLQINFSGDLHNSLSHGVDFIQGLLGCEKFEKVQIKSLDNVWKIKSEYFDLIIQRIEIKVSIFEITIMSEEAKIHYSHTNEKLTITKVGGWYDFEGKFYTATTDSLDFSASNYMFFTYEEMFKLINDNECALTKVDEALSTFNLIEELKGNHV